MLDHYEVTSLCDLLERPAGLLLQEDGCCHQLHQTPRGRDSQLVGGWLADLAETLQQRTGTTRYDAWCSESTAICHVAGGGAVVA